MSRTRAAWLCLGLLAPATAMAAAPNIDLGMYKLVGTYALPAIPASEASAVTYNWDTDTLFVLGDEGDALVEVSKTGAQLSVMTLTGFDDTEGVTYTGNGQFVLTEERLQDAYQMTYVGGGSVDRSALLTSDLGPTVGNIGVEGISYDPLSGDFVYVKERLQQEVNHAQIVFGAAGTTAVVNSLFVPDLGTSDLSDVQLLSIVPGLQGGDDADNLLIYSQESEILLEVDQAGSILSQFDFSSITDDAEGVTIDFDNTIYVVGEAPAMYVLQPVPLPAAAWLFASALVGLGVLQRRKF